VGESTDSNIYIPSPTLVNSQSRPPNGARAWKGLAGTIKALRQAKQFLSTKGLIAVLANQSHLLNPYTANYNFKIFALFKWGIGQ
jgi:hypothetical protein